MFRNLLILLVFMALVGCNQSDSNPGTESKDTYSDTNSHTQDNPRDEPEKDGKIVARVNGAPIYEEDLKGRDLKVLINDEIIYQVGLKKGIDKELRDKVNSYQRTIVLNDTKSKLMEETGPTKKISDEEIQEYYDSNKHKYVNVRIHEISFSNSELSDEILDKAKNGERLEDIASSYPDQAVTTSDIGYNKALNKNFEVIEVDSISDVIERPNGTYTILKVVQVKDVPLKVSKRSIRNILEAKRTAVMIQNYANKIAEENGIEVEIVD